MLELKKRLFPNQPPGAFKAALGEASPLLLGMAAGLQSGQGAYAGAAPGIAAMQQAQAKRQEEEQRAKAQQMLQAGGALTEERMVQIMQSPHVSSQAKAYYMTLWERQNRPASPRYQQITGEAASALGLDPSAVYNVGPDGRISAIGGGAPSATGPEAKIARIMELTNPNTGQPYTRNEAIRVSELVAVSQDGQLVSRETGEVIAPGPSAPAGPEQPQQDAAPVPTFGPAGAATTAINTALDVVGLPLFNEEHEQARQEINNTNTQAMLVLAGQFPGRPSNLTRERIEGIFLNPDALFQGGQRAMIRAENAKSMLAQAYLGAREVAESRSGYTAAQRAEARRAVQAIEPLLANYQRLVSAMEERMAPDDISEEDRALIEKYR